MKIKIFEKIEKPYLGRKEIMLEGNAEITPSKVQLKEEVAKIEAVAPEMIVIKKVEQQFGKKDFKVKVYIYSNKKSLEEFEKEKKKKETPQ